MSEPSQEIKLSFPVTFRNRIRAGFALIAQSKLSIAGAIILPLIGLLFLMLMLAIGAPLTPRVWLIVILCLLAHPALVVTIVVPIAAIGHFIDKNKREPITYSFNDAGIHVVATYFEFTHRWSAISHVKQFGGFLMFFFAPGCAHCIPVRVVQSAGVLESLVAMARRHGANTYGT